MRLLYRMILKQSLFVFLTAFLFFVLILQMVDLFSNLWRYVNSGVAVSEMLRVSWYYFPKCISFSLPISLLFAISFTMGTLYSQNELIAVFGSGVPLYRFVLPFLLLGLLLSLGGFIFEDRYVIPSYRKKMELSRELLGYGSSLSKPDVTIISRGNRLIYHADYYNDTNKTLSNIIILQVDPEGRIDKTAEADWAEWREGRWVLKNASIYQWEGEPPRFVQHRYDDHSSPDFDADPSNFQNKSRDVSEMRIQEARGMIRNLREAGLPYRKALTDYYKRFSFALTPLIVAIVSSAVGGAFKKNILLMSLLFSLILSVLFYVFQMITAILANSGVLSPFTGAWLPFFTFLIASIGAYRWART